MGPYQILAPIGAGGMGEVYRARDTRLDRDVAIKVLPEHLAQNPEALARFEREAKAVAALSHPNILAIHDVGNEGGIRYAVMELLEGETLRSRLERSAPAWRKSVEIGAILADGLAAAHSKDIVHRDLKPENIFLTSDGRVKILDFGLARWQPRRTDSDESPTESQGRTILGTVGYMSPEQARGVSADATSDIFSLGCVLYEMLAGRRAFGRSTPTDTLAAILKDDPPPIAESGKSIPPDLDRIVARCLEKNPQQRFHSAHDLAFALRAVDSPAVARTPRRWLAPSLAALLLAGLAAGVYVVRSRPAVDSLAVLPFANASGDPSTEYLSDGITENLTNSLSQLAGLRVAARSLAFRHKGRGVDPQKAGRDLGVGVVLTGRVVQRGDSLNIQADLMTVADGAQLWGRQYDRKLSDILEVQEQIAREVTEKLRLRPASARRSTENTEAYQLYLKGRYLWNRRTEQTLRRAVEYFQQAIEKDANYAQAWAGLADCYAVFTNYSVEPPREAGPKALAAATRAIQLDESLAEAHTSLAMTKTKEWDWAGAEREFQRATQLNPNYPTTHHWYGIVLSATGRADQDVASVRRAQQLDPLSMVIGGGVGFELYWARRYDEAIVQIRKALEMDPNFGRAHWYLGLPLEQKGLYQEAIAEFQQALRLMGGDPSVIGGLGHAYAVSGNRAEANRRLQELKDLSKQRYVAPFETALVYTGLGDKERAFEWLEKAYEDRSWGMVRLKVDPRLDPLRSDRRFTGLLRRMNLAP